MHNPIDDQLHDDLRRADAALAAAEAANDIREQQRACAFALAAVQRSFPQGREYSSLLRLLFAVRRTIDGPGDNLLKPVKFVSSRSRALPERQLDGYAVMFVRMFTAAGMTRSDTFVRVAKLFADAGMTSHGGGKQTDNDNAGISRAVTPGSIKALWNNSRPGKRLESLGKFADTSFDAIKETGVAMSTVDDVGRLFSSLTVNKPHSVVDLLTTPLSE